MDSKDVIGLVLDSIAHLENILVFHKHFRCFFSIASEMYRFLPFFKY